jgi:hypothetical protein
MSPTDERRLLLIRWMRERPEHEGLTTHEISLVSGVYADAVGPWFSPVERCKRDLATLKSRGLLVQDGRPAKWSLA